MHRRITTLFLAATLSACGGSSQPELDVVQGALACYGRDHRARIELPGDDYYPEGIAVAPDGSFYVGSIGTGAIVRVRPRSTVTEVFLPARPGFGVYGLAVDAARHRLWACTYDDNLAPEQPARLHAYSLASGELLAAYALPGVDGFCNDVALDDRGNVYATDSVESTVVRLGAGAAALETWAADPAFVGEPGAITLNGLSYDQRQRRLLTARYDSGALFSIPVRRGGTAGPPQPILVDVPLELPDGLELAGAHSLVVVEGAGHVSVLSLGPTGAQKVVVQSGLLEPTTAALWGDSAWVVQGQLSHLFGDPEGLVLPFTVERVALP